MVQDWVQVKTRPAKGVVNKLQNSVLNWVRILPTNDNSLELDYVQLPKLRVSGCKNFAECGFALAKTIPSTIFSLKSCESLEAFGLSCGVLQLSDVTNWAEIVIKGSKPSLNLVRNEPAGRLQDFLYFVLGPAILAKWEKTEKDAFQFEPVTVGALEEAIRNAKPRSVLSNLTITKTANSERQFYNNNEAASGSSTPATPESNKESNNHGLSKWDISDGGFIQNIKKADSLPIANNSPPPSNQSTEELEACLNEASLATEQTIEDNNENLEVDPYANEYDDDDILWQECSTESGNIFYFNKTSKLIKWDSTSNAPMGYGLYLEAPITQNGTIKQWVVCITPSGARYWYNPLRDWVTWIEPNMDTGVGAE